jgi:hypothetical protein
MRGLPEQCGARNAGLGSEHHLGRRTFVGLLAAGGTAGIAVAHGLVRPPGAGASTPGAAAAKADGVVVLGHAYLDAHPTEDDADFLVAHLPGIDPTRTVRPQLPALDPAVGQDFAAGRIVSVDGWQLSLTEARAAAAVARGR